jgi:hypothetical protein
MGKKTYSEKLKDPRWQKKRLEILERDGWKCMCCGDKDNTLHVHHIFYIPNTEPWEIHNGFLITLCETCHNPRPCDGNESCDNCADFVDGSCDGQGDPPKDLVSCIGSLLDNIWKNDDIGDFFSMIGYIAMNIGKKNG